MRTTSLLLALIAVAVAMPSDAQYYRPYYGGGGWGGGYGGGWGGGTAAGNYAQGMASMVQAAGEAQLSNSQAAINYQEARSMEYDNRIKGTQTYFEMRKMNQAYVNAERAKPMTTEEAFRFAREAAPKRLSAAQLDPLTGAIAWPPILMTAPYEANRKVMDAMFAARESMSGGIGESNYQSIRKASDGMVATLKANISQYSPNDYIQAKKFVESLSYESRFASN